jgi:hypothetical protein
VMAGCGMLGECGVGLLLRSHLGLNVDSLCYAIV